MPTPEQQTPDTNNAHDRLINPNVEKEDSGKYDHLFNPNHESDGSVEDAAVRPEPRVLSDEEKAQIDARLRERIPQPPLTHEQIVRLEAHRGQPVSQKEIDDMNGARARGIHTSIV